MAFVAKTRRWRVGAAAIVTVVAIVQGVEVRHCWIEGITVDQVYLCHGGRGLGAHTDVVELSISMHAVLQFEHMSAIDFVYVRVSIHN